jgi:hypothetical protein
VERERVVWRERERGEREREREEKREGERKTELTFNNKEDDPC